MVGLWLGIVGLVAVERVAELIVAKRNAAWSFARGGVEHGGGHYPFMVVLHTGFLVACAVEPLFGRPWYPAFGIVAVATQLLRWWCIRTLGPRWNTRVIVVPGLEPVRGGPYRYVSHPNYVAVVAEGIALPMIHGAWMTALGFTVLNAALLHVRIRVENAALRGSATTPPPAGA